jgi:hypothetical protein
LYFEQKFRGLLTPLCFSTFKIDTCIFLCSFTYTAATSSTTLPPTRLITPWNLLWLSYQRQKKVFVFSETTPAWLHTWIYERQVHSFVRNQRDLSATPTACTKASTSQAKKIVMYKRVEFPMLAVCFFSCIGGRIIWQTRHKTMLLPLLSLKRLLVPRAETQRISPSLAKAA